MNKKSFFEFLTFSFIWLQVISLFYQLFYWRHFGVDVFQYIAISDIVFSSGDYLLNFIVMMFLWWFFVQYLPDFKRYFDMDVKSLVPGISALIGLFVFLLLCSLYIPVSTEYVWYAAVVFSVALLRDVSGLLVRPLGISSIFESSRVGYLYLSIVMGSLIFTVPFSNWAARNII
ncbi:hypothetical protein IEI94_05285 [Halomonas sp. ML-15]|uniref:hypothetical protein n=1 Tax=Halomonas sp. ML-15 TaxID=2773305 RepID=UPI0017461D7F|nr:hypothetical protein [Halomonas sp. ML-15]MBD3895260.1 hypothetical protein [Halomonas sp. ML-15]